MELWSRRKFFLTSLASSIAAGAGKLMARPLRDNATALPAVPAQGARPVIISSANGLHALDKGMDILKKGGDSERRGKRSQRRFRWLRRFAQRRRRS
jgi:hypothetical protein